VSDTDTPRTDDQEPRFRAFDGYHNLRGMADFARTLERELSAARAELAEYRKMHDGNLSRIAELSGKVDSLRLTLQDSMSVSRNLRAELATARECLRDIEYDADGIPCQWPTREKRDKAAGMDATAGEVKA